MHPEQYKQIELLSKKYKMPVNKVKELLMPPVGRMFALDGILYKINYINTEKCRISADFVGVFKKEKNRSWLNKLKGVFKREKQQGKAPSDGGPSRSTSSPTASAGKK